MRNELMMLLGVVLLGAAMLRSAGTMAYQQADTVILENVVMAGEVRIELEEPHFQDRQRVYPGSWIDKDPVITNTGISDAFVYLKVGIPIAGIRTADGAVINPSGKTELFTFEADPAWSFLKKEVQEDKAIYTYGYSRVLSPGEKTTALFERIRTVSYLEGELAQDQELEVGITALAVQAVPWPDSRSAYESYFA